MTISKVLLTRRLPGPAAGILREAGFHVEQIDRDDPPPRAELLARLPGTAGLLCTLGERVDAELLDAAGPGLRIVANYGVGFDNIDTAACRTRGIRVSNTPGALTEATADLTWALILSAARGVVEGDRWVRSGQWPGWGPTQLLGLELSGATLGIVGAGRIGSAVARRSIGFGMRVLYVHPRRNEELERLVSATRVPLDRLLSESDVVSLHIPMRPENRHLIGREQLRSMKPTAILINAARGPLIDEAALVEALREGWIAAAGLDVYEHEPQLTPGLSGLRNVVLLPHLGSATHTTRARMARMAAENIIAVLSGRPPLNPVV
jgi:glyoxylate reductase